MEHEGFSTSRARSLQDARQQLQAHPPDVILLDLHLPDGEGMTLLDELDPASSPAVVLITGQASVEHGRRGAAPRRLRLPDQAARRRHGCARSSATSRRHAASSRRSGALRANLSGSAAFGRLVGTSARMQEIYEQIARVAPTDATVLIIGRERHGQGARGAHDPRLSRRRHGPFVALNCGAISPTLIESELFGHERGSFTGADRRHKGVFERADARHAVPRRDHRDADRAAGQAPARARDRHVHARRRRGSRSRSTCAFIAATNRDPDEAVRQGQLREDLLYRLNVFQLTLPPLRERARRRRAARRALPATDSARPRARQAVARRRACEMLREYSLARQRARAEERRATAPTSWPTTTIDAGLLPAAKSATRRRCGPAEHALRRCMSA